MVELIGHHGTTEETAKQIIQHGFKAKPNDKHWLGQGVYFYENNYGEAFGWIDIQCKKSEARPAVLEAKICADDRYFADFNSRSDYFKLYRFAKELTRCNAGHKVVLSADKGKRTCFLYELYAEYYDIRVIRKSFDTKNSNSKPRLGETFDLYYITTQICVKEKAMGCIREIKMVQNTGR